MRTGSRCVERLIRVGSRPKFRVRVRCCVRDRRWLWPWLQRSANGQTSDAVALDVYPFRLREFPARRKRIFRGPNGKFRAFSPPGAAPFRRASSRLVVTLFFPIFAGGWENEKEPEWRGGGSGGMFTLGVLNGNCGRLLRGDWGVDGAGCGWQRLAGGSSGGGLRRVYTARFSARVKSRRFDRFL